MTTRRIWALAVVLLVATVVSAIAPAHPIYNPPAAKFVLGAMAYTAAVWAMEAARWGSHAARGHAEVGFVVSFDDRVICMAYPDGSTDTIRFDEIEQISIKPVDDPDLSLWTGPFHVALQAQGRRLLIPSYSEGKEAFLARLRELPGMDRDGLDTLTKGGEPSACILWVRGNKSIDEEM
jgi:hypothetical protein